MIKKNFFLLLVSFSLSSFSSLYFPLNSSLSTKADTSSIVHKTDASIDEWPSDKFTLDKSTSIQYAIDNDAENLYLALKIPDMQEQIKMMRMGTNLYIDLKGKHREVLGIEFPQKRDIGSDFRDGNTQPKQSGMQEKPDIKKMRVMFALNLISMKLFGFTQGDPVIQNLEMEGSAKIAFSWDSTDAFQIEYMVPLNMLSDIKSLNQKTISVGWKINGMEMPSGNSGFGGPPGGSRPGAARGGSPGGGTSSPPVNMEKMMKEQEIWTKYTFTIQSTPKAF
ncbi:MAG: hypothetical protein JJE22_00385 [Bacteroidia bacterium]|nr:hypothetical protein [Bacteroidia bacterium]